jgi:hypothetical protein
LEVSLIVLAVAARETPAALASSVARIGPLRSAPASASSTTSPASANSSSSSRPRCASAAPPAGTPRTARKTASPTAIVPAPSQSRSRGRTDEPMPASGSVKISVVTCRDCTTDTEPRFSAAACTKNAVVPSAQPRNQTRSLAISRSARPAAPASASSRAERSSASVSTVCALRHAARCWRYSDSAYKNAATTARAMTMASTPMSVLRNRDSRSAVYVTRRFARGREDLSGRWSKQN